MGLMDGVKKQLRSVIEWTNPDPNVLFFKWSENGDEIKNASKLIVSPGIGCIFVYEGKVEAELQDEGLFSLETDNIPFWTTTIKLMQAFESEHKVGIYFFRKANILNVRWGTTSVVKYEDPKYKFPVGLGAYGNYSIRILEPKEFFRKVVAGAELYKVEDLQKIISSRITQPLTDILATSRYAYTEVDANREEIAAALEIKLKTICVDLGFEMLDVRIEGTSFDEATEARINKIADMTAEAQALNALGINYAQKQQLEALNNAAKNEGGIAGLGASLTAGLGLGQAMGNAMNTMNTQQKSEDDPMQKLEKLKKMFDNQLISEDEYKAKKAEILSKM